MAPSALFWWLLAAALVLALGTGAWGLRQWRRARRLAASEVRLQALLANMPSAVITADELGRIQSFNPAAERIFGYRAEEVAGANLRRLMPEPHRSQHDAYIRRYLETGEPRVLGRPGYEVTGRRKDGTVVPLQLSLSEVAIGGSRQFIGVLSDFSAHKALREELEHEASFANAVINSLPGAFYLVDREMRYHRWNRNFELVTGYSGEEIAAMRAPDFFDPADHEPQRAAIEEVFSEGQSTLEADLITKGGNAIPHFWTGFRVELDGAPYLVGMGIDISERKALEAELIQRATTDPLTGIPNRQHFERHLEREVAQADRTGRMLALIMADLDHFKAVNDGNGHEVGDAVLREAVSVIGPWLRGSDLIARWGGEEFMVLAPETGAEGAGELAERLRQALETHDFPGVGAMTASFGVAEYAPGENPGSLVRRVDAALYRAKWEGRNRVMDQPG
ncbi:sensor domain-containing diguanylate cyclase [Thiohalorhabdus sp.]|uniref:sensor domain-containing diguanylate cyclase n=1 Tax=Thiohalorhabdus sp. TaxID=3094134 RepID=UPI002FC2E887